ncbi:MAG: sulfatase-like hydrolase/transferase [Bryobacteraceae bacterium]|nr:sulfatase-like hydrolase/transferase [Bryobacteraceae bacterium]
MTRRTCLQTLATGLGLAAQKKKPNVLILVSDDQGYGDLSSYEHPKEVRTPQMDRLAARGVRFTQGYANAYVCAPSRAAILTGTYPQRYGFYTASDSRVGLPITQSTLADLLKKEGYATGAIGKWHLGLDAPFHPMKRGFDEFYGFLGHGAHDYFDLKPTGQLYNSILRNQTPIEETGYLTDNLGREAVDFIGRHAQQPFFLYLAFNAVHAPMQAPEDLIKKYDTGDPKRNTLLAMLERENDAIGKVLDELDRRKLSQDTLIVFVSDNGGARANSSNNGPLRDYKQSVYEGGIRVPFLISWPGRLKPKTVSDEPVIFADLMPTIAAAVGAAMPAGREGKNLLPVLLGQSKGPVHDSLYWDGAEQRTAIRSGPWKLVSNRGQIELFHLQQDVSEKVNLAAQKPEIVAELTQKFDTWSKANAPRIGKGAANDEDEGGAARKKRDARKKAK